MKGRKERRGRLLMLRDNWYHFFISQICNALSEGVCYHSENLGKPCGAENCPNTRKMMELCGIDTNLVFGR